MRVSPIAIRAGEFLPEVLVKLNTRSTALKSLKTLIWQSGFNPLTGSRYDTQNLTT